MREELIQKLIRIFSKYDIDTNDISNQLYIAFNNYDVTPRETQITVRHEDKNQMFLQKFLIAKSVGGRTQRTLDYYKTELVNILNEIGKPADEITTDDLRYFLAIRQSRDGISKTTANNQLRVLKSFYNFLLADELIVRNPCLKIEKIKQDKVKKEAFAEIEVEKLRGACETSRDKAILEILLSTGCRVTELVNIKIEDIKEDKILICGKGNKYRTVYLNAKSKLAIDDYLRERKDTNPYLFCGGYFVANNKGTIQKDRKNWYKNPKNVTPDTPTYKGTIEQFCRRLGRRCNIAKVHPHRFRRTCATFALRHGMPVEQVSKMLGHESIETTSIYLDLSDEELQQAHKKYVV